MTRAPPPVRSPRLLPMASCAPYVALTFRRTYHYLTAGFALPPDYWHMGWHLSGLFILTYAFFPLIKTKTAVRSELRRSEARRCPYLDLILMVLGVASALYLGFAWRGIPCSGSRSMTFRMGNPERL